MIKENITEEYVLHAIQEIDINGIKYPLMKSRKFDLVFNNNKYPPKLVIAIANNFANGEELDWRSFNTDQALKYLQNLSPKFIIRQKESDPILDLIEKYKNHVRNKRLEDELYKWQSLSQFKGKPDLNAPDFYKEIKSINYKNLIYPQGIAATQHIARERPEQYRSCFKVLFDENNPLESRLKYFNEETLKIYRELVPKYQHHQDERSMSTFLTYFNPDIYTFYQNTYYKEYCKLIGIESKMKGGKYVHYLELIDELINEYLNEDKELLDLVKGIIPSDYFPDTNHKILAQDILYQMLDKKSDEEKNYWRIGTSSSDNTSYWGTMKDNCKICIGWSKIGDLSEKEIKSKKDIAALLKEQDYYPKDNRTLSRKAGEINNFFRDINIGDIVLAQDGSAVLGIGVVTDDYGYDESEGFAHYKPVNWKSINLNLDNKEGLQTTVYKLSDKLLIKKINEILQTEGTLTSNSLNYNTMSIPLNQILFGPPGTGKTYNTVNKALEIIGEKIEGKERAEIKKIFDDKVNEGQIVFTTFHQSMSYEDFIEGIKPVETENEGDDLSYYVEPGIFRNICVDASFSIAQQRADKTTEEVLDFSNMYDNFVEGIEEKLISGKKVELDTKSGGTLMVESISQQGNIIVKHHDGTRTYTVSKARLTKLQTAIKNLSDISNINDQFREIIGGSNSSAYWSVLNAIRKEKPVAKVNKIRRVYSFDEKREVVLSLTKKDYENTKASSFVLIIDEINRGNISQIFGELITLIEKDKRLGKEEALEAILPYSKKKFGVPPNLYIIGTMNTADRSVEALDAALRRRFSFKEIPPDPLLIANEGKLKNEKGFLGNINLPLLLNTINNRIEKLLDKDHQIGHSYFMSITNLNELKATFQNEIIPLLQEYFFGDYGKIGLVLGKGFFEHVEKSQDNIFCDFDDYDASEFAERTIYKIKKIDNLTDADFNEAILILLKM